MTRDEVLDKLRKVADVLRHADKTTEESALRDLEESKRRSPIAYQYVSHHSHQAGALAAITRQATRDLDEVITALTSTPRKRGRP